MQRALGNDDGVFRSGGFPRNAEPGFTPGEALDEVKAGARTQNQ